METIRQYLKRFVKSERGAISIEYIAVGMLVLVIVGGIITYIKDTSGNDIGKEANNKIKSFIQGIGNE
ncbi:TadE/TadG family type IV pilus assembly protein [Brevibacillus migulae]|uniref:TadE/TadG family type IV pilus assembly protein n=1 Tax=Brevibacillus migulae TaxID=1644114 RepID=UPI00106E6717|nr:hypothetical protein [Brevibacillus migulae]